MLLSLESKLLLPIYFRVIVVVAERPQSESVELNGIGCFVELVWLRSKG